MLLVRNKRLRQLIGVTETMSILGLRLALKDPAAFRMWPGVCYRLFVSLRKKDIWASRNLEELFPDAGPITVQVPYTAGKGINTDLDELLTLAILVKLLKPLQIFEIGTFRGRTTRLLAMNAPVEASIYTLDLPPTGRDEAQQSMLRADRTIVLKSDTGVDYRGTPEESKIHQLYGDSTKFDFSPFESKMDLVLVDGGHAYVTARKDSMTAIRITRPGGWVLWHDFGNYGDYGDVTLAVLESVPANEIVQIGTTQFAAWVKPVEAERKR